LVAQVKVTVTDDRYQPYEVLACALEAWAVIAGS
jgi:hypothetical protein